MTERKLEIEKREIPFNQPIKIGLLFFHFIGFSVWYGGVVMGVEVSTIFTAVTIGSGILLVVRELYKDGFVWLIVSEGALNISKVIILIIAGLLKGCEIYFFSIVMLCGLLSSHLPEKVREKRIL